jgi:hypothetical protein
MIYAFVLKKSRRLTKKRHPKIYWSTPRGKNDVLRLSSESQSPIPFSQLTHLPLSFLLIILGIHSNAAGVYDSDHDRAIQP